MQGLPGLNYLVAEVNGANPETDPRVPGKQQSVISFSKKNAKHINVEQGDGFPSNVIFNGEECALPKELPKRSGAYRSPVNLLPAFFLAVFTSLLLTDRWS
ncbi:COBRA-like protein 10 [Forsythia ovata]|uniref:COBRA-like protein 10 n=1 Tax=Forsythia ovata TaxID=205694 RepID=A0ABD1S604_9LAMI